MDSVQSPSESQKAFFNRNWQADPKIHMEIQGTKKSQNNPEREQSWRTHSTWIKTLLRNNSDQDSVVLV